MRKIHSTKATMSACAIIFIVSILMGCNLLTVHSYAACSHSSLGPQYSEAAHPHKYYKTCNLCGQKIYTGGNATKAHGDGSWGSGTCKSCGTCSFTGTRFSEAAHPHPYYQLCACGNKKYTGGNETKAHGDGSWGSGTCPSCGSHKYQSQSTQSTHPHKHVAICACGSTQTFNMLTYSCNQCKANKITARGNSETKRCVFPVICDDLGIGTVVNYMFDCTAHYYNEYNKPPELPGGYFPKPPFASIFSKIYHTASPVAITTGSGVTTEFVANTPVKYYNASNGLIKEIPHKVVQKQGI